MENFSVKQAVQSYCNGQSWKRRFPISIWLPRYRLPYLPQDLIAGLTVALTVLPQGLAYASIAKLPVQYGLYSAYLGCFIYCFLGTSKDISVGPTAIMSLIVATFGKTDPNNPMFHDPAYAVLLAFFAGIVQIVLGVLHLGALTGFISAGVIAGFTSISAITIGFGQVKHLFGLKFSSETFFEDVELICKNIKETNPWDVIIGVGSIIILLTFQWLKNCETRWEKESYTPSRGQKYVWKFLWLIATGRNAIVVVITALIAWTLETQGLAGKVTVTGTVKEGLPPFQLPDFSKPDLFSVLELGLMMVPLIGFLEAIAIGKSFARQNDYKVEPNQELIALGFCNLAGSFLSAYPVTGSFSRTAINSQCSVKSPLAGVVTGGVVMLALGLMTPAFYYIPKSALASVIIVAVLKMVHYKTVIKLWKLRKIELLAFAATCVSSIFLGVAYGTGIGITVDLIIMMYYIARPGITVFQPQSSEQMGHPADSAANVQVRSTPALVVHINSSIFFPATDYIVNLLNEKLHDKDYTRPVIMDFSCVSEIDFTMIEGLQDALKDFKKANAELLFANVKPKIKELLKKARLEGMQIYSTVQDAMRSLEEKQL